MIAQIVDRARLAAVGLANLVVECGVEGRAERGWAREGGRALAHVGRIAHARLEWPMQTLGTPLVRRDMQRVVSGRVVPHHGRLRFQRHAADVVGDALLDRLRHVAEWQRLGVGLRADVGPELAGGGEGG